MCGLAGIVGRAGDSIPPELVERMAASLRHRGPDDSGSYASGAVSFGFRRLSILDLSPAGHQPILSADGRVAMVFNGEIFNFAELRSELRDLGHHFHSSGDTEVLLAAYLQWGVDCLRRLNGMWAFLIHDTRSGVVFGARDRFGVKPLFVAESGGRHYFASEIKGLHAVLPESREVDRSRVARLLAAGRLERLESDQGTFFAAVREVEPGTWFQIGADGAMRTGRYWEFPEEELDPGLDPVAEFRDLFMDAVRLRLRSDVPVGVALSGGLDSSSIICAMARLRSGQPVPPERPIHAFTFLSPGHDESEYLMSVLAQTGATQHVIEFAAARWWDTLPEVLRSHDEPVHSASASVGHEIYRVAARDGIKVLLVGQGADETLAGYQTYHPDRWQSLLRERRWRSFLGEIRDYSVAFGESPRRNVAMASLRFVLQQADRFALYRSAMASRRLGREYPYRHLLTPDMARLLPSEVPPGTRGLRAALIHGTTRTPLPLYLRVEDRNSMAHSVEARLPFLDYRLVSLAFRLSGHWKLRGGWNKYLLRQATEGLLPESVRLRVDKMGFPTRLSRWLRHDVRGPVMHLFQSPAFRQRGLVNPDAAQEMLRGPATGPGEGGSVLFNMVQTELWMEGLENSIGPSDTRFGDLPQGERERSANE